MIREEDLRSGVRESSEHTPPQGFNGQDFFVCLFPLYRSRAELEVSLDLQLCAEERLRGVGTQPD